MNVAFGDFSVPAKTIHSQQSCHSHENEVVQHFAKFAKELAVVFMPRKMSNLMKIWIFQGFVNQFVHRDFSEC